MLLKNQVHSKPVPLISSVAAGNWKDIGDNYDPKDEQDWVLSTATTSENAFALRIQGDSMEPDIKDNEIVIVDPLRIAEHNSIVIVIQNGNTEATCKQLVIDGGKRYLKPINPRYPIMEMQADARLCGVVVQSLKTWI
jgi:SOS-response transcriptional repressor LexA